MIIGLLILIGWIVFGLLVLREFRRLMYVRDMRQLPKVTEWQARQNAAPLTNAIISREGFE